MRPPLQAQLSYTAHSEPDSALGPAHSSHSHSTLPNCTSHSRCRPVSIQLAHGTLNPHVKSYVCMALYRSMCRPPKRTHCPFQYKLHGIANIPDGIVNTPAQDPGNAKIDWEEYAGEYPCSNLGMWKLPCPGQRHSVQNRSGTAAKARVAVLQLSFSMLRHARHGRRTTIAAACACSCVGRDCHLWDSMLII